ncbi:MAG: DNA double-strand break repair nuclease NurA [Microcystaceae cyanobacterium]
MLDLAKLAGKMPGMSQHFKKEVAASRQRLEKALNLFELAQEQQQTLSDRYHVWRDRLFFSVALPVESLTTRKVVTSYTQPHSVFATDGSQIAPSHHEVAYCYLINIGRIMLHYGQNLHPLLDSIPEVYYRKEDLYASKQWGIRTEEWMGYRRGVLEAQCLAEMACRWVNPPGPHTEPNLAMVDGSLIYWFLEGLPQEARDKILQPMLTAWEELRSSNIPLVGYISASRSSEAMNFLRLEACSYDTSNCAVHCSGLEEGTTPCQVFEPLRDATFWSYLLEPGQRSPLWQSSARILELYPPEQRIYFCYLNVGTEVARVELPAWLVQNPTLLEQSLGILLAQVNKGYGYPVAIAEAHNQAVVRGGDRARFFALLEQQMLRTGMQNVGTSYKEARKRGSIV